MVTLMKQGAFEPKVTDVDAALLVAVIGLPRDCQFVDARFVVNCN